MKKFLKKAWVFFLVMSIPAAIITFFVAFYHLNEDSLKPAIICLLSASWVLWMIVCNEDRGDKKKRRREYEEDETRDRKNAS